MTDDFYDCLRQPIAPQLAKALAESKSDWAKLDNLKWPIIKFHWAAGTWPWVDIEETAALLGLTDRQVNRREAAGKMPPRFTRVWGIKSPRTNKCHYLRRQIEAMAADGNGSGQP